MPSLPKSPTNPPKAGWNRRPAGIILGLVLFFLTAVFLVVMTYGNLARQEAWRVHRVYWNDQVTKAAEGIAEEAFAWFLANPDPAVNPVYAFLLDPAETRQESDLFAVTPRLLTPNALGEVDLRPGEISCTMKAVGARPLFHPSGEGAFDAIRAGEVVPDPGERVALLVVRVELGKRGFRRAYEVVREVKAISLLPGVFGQFTLFVQRKLPGYGGDPNHLRMTLISSGSTLTGVAGFADPGSPLGTPLTLIHHPGDFRAPGPYPSMIQVAPPTRPEWPSLDLARRGWIFLGPRPTPGPAGSYDPFRQWAIQPFTGAARQAMLFPDRLHRFFGALFMLCNHQTLIYHSLQPAFRTRVPPPGLSWNDPPFSGDPDGIPFPGCLFVINRTPWYSGYQTTSDMTEIGDSHRNFFSREIGALHWEDPRDGSLLVPMGDLTPISSSEIRDNRSPTLLFGPALLKFRQNYGKIQQMPGSLAAAAALDQGGLLASMADIPREQRPHYKFLPYFETRGGRMIDLPASPIRWDAPDGWATVTDPRIPGRDFAAVNWNAKEVIADPRLYSALMCKVISAYPMSVFDLYLQDNMRGVDNPTGWLPTTHSLTSLPSVLQPLDATGGPVSETATAFFFSPAGRGVTGNRLLIKDTAGRPLARGNLAALWPFVDQAYHPHERGFAFSGFDLRHKTTHLAADAADFHRRFIRKDRTGTRLDLRGAIVTVEDGDLTLETSDGGPLWYRDGGMIIVSHGTLTIRSPIRRTPEGARAPLVLATGPQSGPGSPVDIFLDLSTRPPTEPAVLIEAYLVSSGTIGRKRSSLSGTIRGGLAVRHLDFSETNPDSFFAGHPRTIEERSVLIWDPVFNVLDPATRQDGFRLHLGPSRSFWKTEPL